MFHILLQIIFPRDSVIFSTNFFIFLTSYFLRYSSRFFDTYFQGRVLFTGYKNIESRHFHQCTLGVPQGSSLGPLLYLRFASDVESELQNAKILLYADDMKIYYPIGKVDDWNRLWKNLDTIVRCSERNFLPFNAAKCEKITYTEKKTRFITREYSHIPPTHIGVFYIPPLIY